MSAETLAKYMMENKPINIPEYEPIYWQATGVKAIPGRNNPDKETFYRHFILRVSWPQGSLNNTDKETDIIYISVKAANAS